MSEFIKVAKADEIAPGRAKCVELNDREIALFNVDGSFYAIDNTCAHVGGPLSEGELDGARVTCPWHGAVFDVTTGAVLGPPAGTGVAKYNTRVEGGDVEIEV
jgi:nitrite reductase/ring-hydroxylating ferredoxin subunit